MANQFDVHNVVIPVELTGATQIPVFKHYEGGGAMTVIAAHMINAGTSVGPLLVTMSNVGTPALNGTIGYFAAAAAATITESATIPRACTISDGYVADGEWIGFDQTSGTVPAGSKISLSYVMGK